MKILFYAFTLFAMANCAPAFATVSVSSPANGATVSPSVQYVATANTNSCSLGVAATGIYVDDVLQYVSYGANLNTNLRLSAGTHKTVVQEWDYCGGATLATVNVTVSQGTGLTVSSPTSGATVGSPATFVASGSSACPQGVAAMGVYVNDQLAYVTQGSALNTQLPLTAGTQKVLVTQWDQCGESATTKLDLTVTGTTLSNLQAIGGWNQWGEMAPVYDICSPSQCPGVTWFMNQHVNSPSLTGDATQFNIAGTTPYSDVLWSNPIIGQNSTQGLPDNNHKLLPSIHNLTLDTQVYVTNFSVTQDLEFDINMYMNGVGMQWGTECNHLDHGVWDIWDNVNAKWLPTSIPCSLNNNNWNRVTLQVQRQSNNDLLYQTLTVNGTTYTINQTVPPFPVPSGWWGMTVNYQMDGDYKQSPNTTYLDKLNVTYW